MNKYLQVSEIIDWQHPAVIELAQKIAGEHQTERAIIKACFEWVRDQIRHSCDYQMNPVTCQASEVLYYKTGFCYAKSHLLAALLRANQISTGFCYQRLSINDQEEPYCLHGLNAVFLADLGWYRIDPRGNQLDINAQFNPPQEQLAYQPKLVGESDCKRVFSEPLAVVVNALQSAQTWDKLLLNLPDLPSEILESN